MSVELLVFKGFACSMIEYRVGLLWAMCKLGCRDMSLHDVWLVSA